VAVHWAAQKHAKAFASVGVSGMLLLGYGDGWEGSARRPMQGGAKPSGAPEQRKDIEADLTCLRTHNPDRRVTPASLCAFRSLNEFSFYPKPASTSAEAA
jgi:hypothetical protein